MRIRLAIFFADRGDVAVLKTHVIKSSNLMSWLYWRFAAINVENRGNEFNRRYLTCQISAILYADRGDRRIKSPSVSLALSGRLTWDFIRRSPRSAKIARCAQWRVLKVMYLFFFPNCYISLAFEKAVERAFCFSGIKTIVPFKSKKHFVS